MKFNIIQNNQLNFSDGIIILPTFENEMVSFKKLDITPEILTISNDLINLNQKKVKYISLTLSPTEKLQMLYWRVLEKRKI